MYVCGIVSVNVFGARACAGVFSDNVRDTPEQQSYWLRAPLPSQHPQIRTTERTPANSATLRTSPSYCHVVAFRRCLLLLCFVRDRLEEVLQVPPCVQSARGAC